MKQRYVINKIGWKIPCDQSTDVAIKTFSIETSLDGNSWKEAKFINPSIGSNLGEYCNKPFVVTFQDTVCKHLKLIIYNFTIIIIKYV